MFVEPFPCVDSVKDIARSLMVFGILVTKLTPSHASKSPRVLLAKRSWRVNASYTSQLSMGCAP